MSLLCRSSRGIAESSSFQRSGLPTLPQLPTVGAQSHVMANSALSDGNEVDMERDMDLKENEEVEEEEGDEEEEEEGAHSSPASVSENKSERMGCGDEGAVQILFIATFSSVFAPVFHSYIIVFSCSFYRASQLLSCFLSSNNYSKYGTF